MGTSAEPIAVSRLPSRLARDVFRTVLDALAQPGRRYQLPASTPGELPPAVVPALALADLDVRVSVVGPGPKATQWAQIISTVSGASIVAPDVADWLVALEPPDADTIARLPAGSALSPESGARLTIGCDRIVDGATDHHPDVDHDVSGVRLRIAGPGVPASDVAETAGGGTGRRSSNAAPHDHERMVRLIGVDREIVTALIDKNRDFPAGVDTWCCAADGTVIGIPRSSTLTVLDDNDNDDGDDGDRDAHDDASRDRLDEPRHEGAH